MMNKECMGIINLNKKGNEISKLTDGRIVASIPIGGRYRVVDFVLSNMVNSGMRNIGVFADQKYRSLTDHLGNGKDWDLSSRTDGLFVFSPENTKDNRKFSLKKGDIYNIFSNIDYIEKSNQEYVLIAPSYMICNIDYKSIIKNHKKSGNDITVVYKNVENANEDFLNCFTLNLNDDNQVLGIGNNLGRKSNENISMEMYIMKRQMLIDMLYDEVSNGSYAYICDVIHNYTDRVKIGAYEYTGYLKCINSVNSYFSANKDFLNLDIAKELFYSDRKISTKEKKENPTLYTENANTKNSFIATGCTIEGEIKDSIIFRKVHIKEGASIENCIVMQNCVIEEGVNLKNAILDKNVYISENKELKGDINLPIVIEKNANI